MWRCKRGKRRHTVTNIYLNKMLVTLKFPKNPKWESQLTCIVVEKRTTYTYTHRHTQMDTKRGHATVRKSQNNAHSCILIKEIPWKISVLFFFGLSQFSHEVLTFIFFHQPLKLFIVHCSLVSRINRIVLSSQFLIFHW